MELHSVQNHLKFGLCARTLNCLASVCGLKRAPLTQLPTVETNAQYPHRCATSDRTMSSRTSSRLSTPNTTPRSWHSDSPRESLTPSQAKVLRSLEALDDAQRAQPDQRRVLRAMNRAAYMESRKPWQSGAKQQPRAPLSTIKTVRVAPLTVQAKSMLHDPDAPLSLRWQAELSLPEGSKLRRHGLADPSRRPAPARQLNFDAAVDYSRPLSPRLMPRQEEDLAAWQRGEAIQFHSR